MDGHDRLFGFLYEDRAEDVAVFEGHWCRVASDANPKDWNLCARFEKVPGSDGQSVEIYDSRWPARFYRLRALPDKNSIGAEVLGFTLSTGSGREMAELMVQLAKAISQGMVAMRKEA